MATLNNMKIGWIGFIYQPPKELTEPMDKLFWQLDQAKRLGCEVLQPIVFKMPSDDASIAKITAKMKECGVEYEMGTPRAVFELCGDNAAEAKKELQDAIDLAKKYGAKIMRCGYPPRAARAGARMWAGRKAICRWSRCTAAFGRSRARLRSGTRAPANCRRTSWWA